MMEFLILLGTELELETSMADRKGFDARWRWSSVDL